MLEIFKEGWQRTSEQLIINFGGDPNHCLDTEIVFRICHYWEIREVVNSFILMMAALVRRALAEVCTVPLLVTFRVSRTRR